MTKKPKRNIRHVRFTILSSSLRFIHLNRLKKHWRNLVEENHQVLITTVITFSLIQLDVLFDADLFLYIQYVLTLLNVLSKFLTSRIWSSFGRLWMTSLNSRSLLLMQPWAISESTKIFSLKSPRKSLAESLRLFEITESNQTSLNGKRNYDV